MSWIAIKSFTKKAFLWMKEYWQVPFLIAWTTIVWVFARKNSQAIADVMAARTESYKKQIQVLRESHNDELLKRDGLVERYEETMRALQESLEEKEKSLAKKQREEIKEVVLETKGNPDGIRKRIEEEFGIKFVE